MILFCPVAFCLEIILSNQNEFRYMFGKYGSCNMLFIPKHGDQVLQEKGKTAYRGTAASIEHGTTSVEVEQLSAVRWLQTRFLFYFLTTNGCSTNKRQCKIYSINSGYK